MQNIENYIKIRTNLILCIALMVLILLPYFQVRNHEFVDLDDYDYIVENHHIRNGLTVDGVIWAFNFQKDDQSYWRPLTWVSHMLDFELFGADAGRHHLSNLLLHMLNALLVFYLLYLMTGKSGSSFITSALFAIHPINVESVAWVTERSNLLCTFAGLVTMYLYLRYTRELSVSRYLMVILSLILCLMVKPILVTLPFLFLLIDFWPLNRFQVLGSDGPSEQPRIGRIIVEKIPLLLICLLAIWISLLRQGNTISVDQVSFHLRLSNAVVAYVRYLSNLFYPVNLTAFYPFPKVIPLWQTLGSALILVMISIFVVLKAKTKPYLFLGWFWFTGTMFPKIGLVQAGLWPALADRWAYFPAIGLFIVVAWSSYDFLVKRFGLPRRVIDAAFVIVFVILGTLTWKQAGFWSNSTRLFVRMIDKTQGNYMAHNNLGTVLLSQGNPIEAEKHFLEAIAIKPDFEIPYLNIGKLAYTAGDVAKARAYYEKAIALRPNNYAAHLALGNLNLREGQYHDAWRHYSEAVRIDSDGALPYNGMGGVLTKIGRLEEAAAMYAKALEIDPGYEPAQQNLARVLEAMRSRQTQ